MLLFKELLRFCDALFSEFLELHCDSVIEVWVQHDNNDLKVIKYCVINSRSVFVQARASGASSQKFCSQS
jgi:hypothetical protein